MKRSRKILLIVGIVLALPILTLLVLNFDTSVFYSESGLITIEKFNSNRSDFEAIRKYMEETEGTICINVDTRLLGKVYYSDPIQSEEISEKIDKLISELHLKGIYEDLDSIRFARIANNDEYGIVYCPNGKVPFITLDERDLGDGWFYYQIYH